MIPSGWSEGVGATAIPDFAAIDALPTELERAEAEARAWMTFGVSESAQREAADGRTRDTIHIVTTCEELHNEARPRRRFLGIF